jgi:hypothetical protein
MPMIEWMQVAQKSWEYVLKDVFGGGLLPQNILQIQMPGIANADIIQKRPMRVTGALQIFHIADNDGAKQQYDG